MANQRKENRNKPNKPLAELAKKAGTKPRWWGERQVYLDVELTGLQSSTTINLGPETFRRNLIGDTDRQQIIGYRALQVNKYFENIGLAQLAAGRRVKAQDGIYRWEFDLGNSPLGYTYWGEKGSRITDVMNSSIEISEFSQRQGIISRSLEALAQNRAISEREAVTEFGRQLTHQLKWGGVTIRAQNAWFDVHAVQHFLTKHAGSLEAAGMDPLFFFKGVQAGLLNPQRRKGVIRVESLEEYYFDLLRWRGMRDRDWASKHLVYGEKAASMLGQTPHSPINLELDWARRVEGEQSHLRGRAGWKLENLKSVMGMYQNVDQRVGTQFKSFGQQFKGLQLHDAAYDDVLTHEAFKTFKVGSKLINRYTAAWGDPKSAYNLKRYGFIDDEIIGVMAFARSGLLGEEFRYNNRWKSLAKRLQGDQDFAHRAKVRYEAVWNQMTTKLEAQRKMEKQRRYRIKEGKFAGAAQKPKGKVKFTEYIKNNKKASIALGLGLFGAFGFSQLFKSRPETNVPSNYIEGQQAKEKAVDVPFSSPYLGMETDESNALLQLGIGVGATYGLYNAPKLATNQDVRLRMYAAARLVEDASPFRLLRIFGLSSVYSSYLVPEAYNVNISNLVNAGDELTAAGRIYARALNLGESSLANRLHEMVKGGQTDLIFRRTGRGPFATVNLGSLGERSVRFFETTSRLAGGFSLYGAPKSDVLPPLGSKRNLHARIRRSFAQRENDTIKNYFRRVGERLYGTRVGKKAFERYYSIPKWDVDALRSQQRGAYAGKELYTPAYTNDLKGLRRAAGGLGYDFLRSGYDLMRSQASLVGINVGPATNVRTMLKNFGGKVGLPAAAAIGAFTGVNEFLGGALTDPFWNLFDRARIARAQIGETTGFTDIRQQQPNIPSTAFIAAAVTPLIAKKIIGTGYKVHALYTQDRPAVLSGAARQVRRTENAKRQVVREEIYQGAKDAWDQKLNRLFYKPGQESGKLSTLYNRLNIRGKIGMAIWGGVTASLLPFAIGDQYSTEEVGEILSGERKVPIRKGRFWEFSATPYEGGRVSYYRLHQSARRKLELAGEVPGSEERSLFGLLLDPYKTERETYYDRPYPITASPFEDIPLIGPLLAGTIGRFIKPPARMHTERFSGDEGSYEPTPGMGPVPGMGGLAAPAAADPYGLRAQVRQGFYRLTEFAGLRGFLGQSVIGQNLFGGSVPFENMPTLQPARYNSFTDQFWEAELGGMAFTNELFRRFFPKRESGLEINPIENRMPTWMPGKDYFVNFKEGDPYNKVPYGEERLPGPGYAKYRGLQGVNPEDYPDWAKYEILADVAPWSKQYKIFRASVRKQAEKDPQLAAFYDRIESQAEEVRTRNRFEEKSFTEDTDKITGTVIDVGTEGTFRLEEYPTRIFRLGGVSFGRDKVADHIRNINGTTKERAVELAFKNRLVAQERMQELMEGRRVTLRVHKGALATPDIEAEAYVRGRNIARTLGEEGLAAPTGGRETAGGLARLYGGYVERLAGLPHAVPGPFFAFTKFFNQADAIEEYKRSELYGSGTRFWDKPWEDFARPYIMQTISKLTPGEFVPPHVQERRETDVVLDRLAFLKYQREGRTGKAMRTAAGMDPYGNVGLLKSAMPYRERPFFEAFLEETDPSRRRTILSMVSSDMQQALQAQWTKQAAQAEGLNISNATSMSQRMTESAQMAAAEIQSAGYNVPDDEWIGWNENVEVEDIQARFILHEGLDRHDFNIWDDRLISQSRKPYLRGAVEGLTSRPMLVPPTIISRNLDRRRQQSFVVNEGINRDNFARFNMHNRSDYSEWESTVYQDINDRLFTGIF